MKDVTTRMPDAFREPQRVQPGCMHQLGCKCTPPYHLRASSPIEEAREDFLRRPFIFPTTAEDEGFAVNGEARRE